MSGDGDEDDLAARARSLAQTLLGGLDAPEDPNQAALDAQEERRKARSLEEFYVQTGQAHSLPRFPGVEAATARQLLQEIDRQLPLIAPVPQTLSPEALRVSGEANRAVLRGLNELFDRLPPRSEAIPGLDDDLRGRCQWLCAEHERRRAAQALHPPSLNIELRDVQADPARSLETLAFLADLYVDGQRVGMAEGTGDGRVTMVEIDEPSMSARIEAYARELSPPAVDARGRARINEIHLSGPLAFVVDRLTSMWSRSQTLRIRWTSAWAGLDDAARAALDARLASVDQARLAAELAQRSDSCRPARLGSWPLAGGGSCSLLARPGPPLDLALVIDTDDRDWRTKP